MSVTTKDLDEWRDIAKLIPGSLAAQAVLKLLDALKETQADRDWLAKKLAEKAPKINEHTGNEWRNEVMSKPAYWLKTAARVRITLPEPAKSSEGVCQE